MLSPLILAAAVGLGLADDGYTNLPARRGATVIYVNNAGRCSDNQSGRKPASPKCTIAAALAEVPRQLAGGEGQGRGDHVLVAEGTSYAEGIGISGRQFGYSAAYPTVVESYDPAAPLDAGRWGRAGTTGHGARPQIRDGWHIIHRPAPGTGDRFCGLAIRGFDIAGVGAASSPDHDCFLIENNRFSGVFLTVGGNYVTIRRNSFNGGAPKPGAYKAQNIFAAGTNLLIEQNVITRGGWPVGQDRSCPKNVSCTPNIYNHNIYLDTKAKDAVVRDNLITDASAQGLQLRGGGWATGNVFIDNPIAMTIGGGTGGDDCIKAAPTNVHRVSGNIFIGGTERLNGTQSPHVMISAVNGQPGSYIRDNLAINSPWDAAFLIRQDGCGPPAVLDVQRNVVADVGVHRRENLMMRARAVPRRYRTPDVYAALGFRSKDAFMAEAVAHPEIDWTKRFRFLFAAYGVRG